MMATAFLTTLQSLGVEVSAASEQLRYRDPQGLLTPALREHIARHKEVLLAALRQSDVAQPVSLRNDSCKHNDRRKLLACATWQATSEEPPAVRLPVVVDRYPLSPAQERLWFMDQLVTDSALYNEALALRLSGALNIPALADALNEVVRRHEALRTSFAAVDGQPCQHIYATSNLEVRCFELRHLPDKACAARALAREFAGKPFKLNQPPLIRAGLLTLAPDEHLLVFGLHHIICDGWSSGILLQEMSQLYNAYCRGEASPLPEPALQYSDFTLWQRQRINRGELDSEMQYWQQQLGPSLPVMELPADRPRPLVPSYRGASLGFELCREISQEVKDLSRANGVTTFMTLLAAWQVLLGRYCAQDEVVVGTVAANRSHAGLEQIIGLMVNTLPIKGELTDNPTFQQLLARVKEVAIGAYQHQELPYEKLVAELAVQRDVSRRPIIEMMLVMEQGLTRQVEWNGLTVSEAKIDTETAKYDLMISLQEKGDRFAGRIEYATDLFDEPRIRRIAESYQRLISAIVAQPDQRVKDLPLLTESEQRLLIEWNDTAVPYADHKNIHQMFEEQVARMPDAIAAVYEAEHLTYHELNGRANQWADHLRRSGVAPGSLVGLCVERSLDMTIGVLAILKAGGAYLPLDPAYPKDRLSFMLADAQSAVLLTQKHLLERLPDHQATVVCMDSDRSVIKDRCREDSAAAATTDDLAYVIYTSGSTGRPKGTSLPHGALVNLIRWHAAAFRPLPRSLQFASPSFDVSFYEMFTTWAAGGTLFIITEESRMDIPALAGFLADHAIEKAVLPVVVLQQLAEEHRFRGQRLTSLREVITTGEQLQITRPVVNLFTDFRLCSLHNHYGPSETHVVTAYSLNAVPDSWPAHPCIGKPIANAQMYILDQHLNLAPLGTLGELHIGGVSLARGYLHRPDLTAERFVPNPFSRRSGQRLYKTGDLVHYLNDGSIAFIGRADHQVKVRGFRVELGEIEAVLNQHPAVRESVVVTRETAPGHQHLVAYVAADRKQRVTADDLRAHLRERLPEHMLPAAYITMEKLPLTANGKIDRSALTLSYRPSVAQPEDLVQARTPAEELVAKIWREVLDVEKIGINSNFFSLGGHSLLASQIILRLREIFCVDIPVRGMFEAPTVSGIVKVLSGIWGGREIVEEIAWTYSQVEQLSDQDTEAFLAQHHSKCSAE